VQAARALAGGWLCLAVSWPLSALMPQVLANCLGLGLGSWWVLRGVGRTLWGKRPLGAGALGLSVGLVTCPAWLAVLAWPFQGLGLLCPPIRPDGSWPALLAACLLAPLFEEALYRGCLLPEWSLRLGRLRAVGLTSVLFALPHFTWCAALPPLCVGVVLGTVQLRFRSLAFCVGYHAGLNVFVCLGSRSGNLAQ